MRQGRSRAGKPVSVMTYTLDTVDGVARARTRHHDLSPADRRSRVGRPITLGGGAPG
jgi:hypothetical protein